MLAKPFLLAFAVVSLPLAVVYWLSVTSRFDLKRIELSGTELVAEEQVLSILAPVLNRHLLLLSLNDVEEQVRKNRWVEGATIRKELPDALMVEIHERVPVGLLRHENDLYYVDRSGFLIEPYSLEGPVDLPILTADSGVSLNVDRVLSVADRFSQAAPSWGAGLSEIEVLGEDDFRFHLAALEFPVLVSTGTVERQLANLQSILPEIMKRYEVPVTVDLRFSRQIVIQPAVQPRSEKG
jgi:cell division protein FtsQ